MSALWIIATIVAVLFGLGFAGWGAIKFVEAIVQEIMKGLWK